VNRLSRRQFVVGAGTVGVSAATGFGLLAGCGRLPWLPEPPPARVPRLGVLLAATPDAQAERLQAFQEGLADYGYVEGRDITLEVRYANGALDRMPALAAELVALPVAVIVTGATPMAEVVRQVTSTIPIVVAGSGGDLVNSGLAASWAHPGGNVTGLSIPAELEGKRLQLLTQAASGISRVAVLRERVRDLL
jgi:putative ABC transport system substrate-binding protein